MTDLEKITNQILAEFETKYNVREQTLKLSRALIRQCSLSIRAIHRHEFQEARQMLTEVQRMSREMQKPLSPHPDLLYTGYALDALKETVEANTLLAIVVDEQLPSPEELHVPGNVYLLGLAEAANELRRYILDLIRHDQLEQGEQLLTWMDNIYATLVIVDYPDALTRGLRRQTDVLRSILERTRGDLTLTSRQQRLEAKLQRMEGKADKEA